MTGWRGRSGIECVGGVGETGRENEGRERQKRRMREGREREGRERERETG